MPCMTCTHIKQRSRSDCKLNVCMRQARANEKPGTFGDLCPLVALGNEGVDPLDHVHVVEQRNERSEVRVTDL